MSIKIGSELKIKSRVVWEVFACSDWGDLNLLTRFSKHLLEPFCTKYCSSCFEYKGWSSVDSAFKLLRVWRTRYAGYLSLYKNTTSECSFKTVNTLLSCDLLGWQLSSLSFCFSWCWPGMQWSEGLIVLEHQRGLIPVVDAVVGEAGRPISGRTLGHWDSWPCFSYSVCQGPSALK